mgnify:CR=1 FL=1
MEFMDLKIDKQQTCESCLSVCLMNLLEFQKGIKLDQQEEYNILFEGLKFTRLDFSTGHLVYLSRKFPNLTFEQYIDFNIFYKILERLDLPKNLKMHSKKINLKFLKKITKENPVIIYVDMFTLEGIYHYSHFVILKEINNENATIFDPWSGEKIEMKTKILMKSISYIRNKLKISPKLIKIK